MVVLGMGSDVVECLRIAQLIERHGELFLRRVFTAREIEYCSSRKSATQHYAARWAGKNAVLRAMRATQSPGHDWRDVEIRPQHEGQTSVALAGEIRQICVTLGIAQLVVSIAHCRTHATAHALALGPPAEFPEPGNGPRGQD